MAPDAKCIKKVACCFCWGDWVSCWQTTRTLAEPHTNLHPSRYNAHKPIKGTPYMHACMHACIHTYEYLRVCIYKYVYIYMYVPTFAQKYIPGLPVAAVPRRRSQSSAGCRATGLLRGLWAEYLWWLQSFRFCLSLSAVGQPGLMMFT